MRASCNDPRGREASNLAFAADRLRRDGNEPAARRIMPVRPRWRRRSWRRWPPRTSSLDSTLAVSAAALWFKARDAYKLDELATRLLASDALTPGARAEIAEMRAEALKDLTPDRRPRRAPGWWALGLTAAASLAIGRASVARQARSADARTPGELDGRRAVRGSYALAGPHAARPGGGQRFARAPHGPDDARPLGPDPKRDAPPRTVRREAVTQAEALEAAQRAVPSLRTCTDVPRHVTADLDIVRGRGVVTALNLHPWIWTIQRPGTVARCGVSSPSGSPSARQPDTSNPAAPAYDPELR